MKVVLMSELPITMVVQSAHHNTATRATGGRGSKRVAEYQAVASNGINRWGVGNLIAVATERRALVIGDDEQDVPFGTTCNICNRKAQQQRKEESVQHRCSQKHTG